MSNRDINKRLNLEKLEEERKTNKKIRIIKDKDKDNIKEINKKDERNLINTLNDKNIDSQEILITPRNLKLELAPFECDKMHKHILDSRIAIENILARNGKDNRFICVVGPCSIHKFSEAMDYAKLLKKISDKFKDKILLVMRVYFEKPRTIDGWKGYINDPNLDGTYQIDKGLHYARKLLIEINKLGLPCGSELLDTISPQYIADLISWGAIGARTCESQVHRQMVSGLSMPVGFKNGTLGDIQAPVNSIIASSKPYAFIGVNENGMATLCKTTGNNATHIIMRGSKYGPNYKEANMMEVSGLMEGKSLLPNIMIDCSHGNSSKNYKNQSVVVKDIIRQLNHNKKNERKSNIIGLMLESNINYGGQKLVYGEKTEYGVSITDSCIGIQETYDLIKSIYEAL